MIGCISYEKWIRLHRRVEIAYDLNPNYWRQGIMSACLAKVFEYTFDVMKANRIDAFTTTYNEKSINLLQKMGFEQDGVLKEYRWFKNEYIDVLIFGFTRSKYKKDHSFVKKLLTKLNNND